LITDEIFAIIHQLSRSGVTILLVEQNAAGRCRPPIKPF
jgi:phenylacetate-CoA ligase